MMIEYRKADIADAELLISIYNSAFYRDYIKYGECPAYGKTKEFRENLFREHTEAAQRFWELHLSRISMAIPGWDR